MRIRILSDLHREFGTVALPDVAADSVLAGDIDRGVKGVAWAPTRFPETPVLYIAGNHEFYDERIGRLHEKFREAAAGSNITILENETYEWNGYRFFGATLWSDFAPLGDRQSAMLAAGDRDRGMNDYRKIRRADAGKLQPKHTALLHADSRLALTKFLSAVDRTKSVVITHHAPSIRSAMSGTQNDLITAAYASDMEELINTQGPALWIHGHIHEVRDSLIGSTRVLNNSLGYQTFRNPESTGFKPDLVLEL
jgi:predicted phosphohydrolase